MVNEINQRQKTWNMNMKFWKKQKYNCRKQIGARFVAGDKGWLDGKGASGNFGCDSGLLKLGCSGDCATLYVYLNTYNYLKLIQMLHYNTSVMILRVCPLNLKVVSLKIKKDHYSANKSL